MKWITDLFARAPRFSFAFVGAVFIVAGVSVLTHSTGWSLVGVGVLILLAVVFSCADEFTGYR